MRDEYRVSEQTFHVAVGISDSILPGIIPATSESEAFHGDYVIPGAIDGLQTIIFKPDMIESKYIFSIFSDEYIEGREGFVIFSMPSEGSTTYTTPNMLSKVFRSTTVIIQDLDCEHCCEELYGLVFQIHYYLLLQQ